MSFPLNLLLLLSVSVAAALLLLLAVRRHPQAGRLRETNDIAGYYFTILGGLYGVFLGFMVLVVQTRFDQAETLTEQEATAATTLFVMAGGLSEPYRNTLRSDLTQYVSEVADREWPILGGGGYQAPEAFQTFLRLYETVGRMKPRDSREQSVVSEALSRLHQIHETRRLRLLANRKTLPFVYQGVLIGGAILTVVSTALFGVERFGLHALKTALLTALICLMLFAIHEVDRPFRGEIRVSVEPFRRARLFFGEIRTQEAGRFVPTED
ncbi:MAG: hypothetical protein SFU56_20545 [Capsulimonadales bacterium]|nr:hypothetical protein [Capsulimonadales bacterium]